MNTDDDALRERLVGVLDGHAEQHALCECASGIHIVWNGCSCDIDIASGSDYAAHVADALLPVLADVRAEAAREALRSAANDVGPALQNEIGSGHTSTYSVRRWLNDRVDRIGGERR